MRGSVLAPAAEMTTWVFACAVIAAVAVAPMTKYHIKVKVDSDTNFDALRTYAWTPGWATFDPGLDSHIVAAVDRELASIGLMQRGAGPSDVLVTYGALRRTNVDVHGKADRRSGAYPEYAVGTLVVMLLEPGSRRELVRARVEMPVDMEQAQIEGQIDMIVHRMFTHYPTRAFAR